MGKNDIFFTLEVIKTYPVGFHIIILKEHNKIDHKYVETYEKLAYISGLSKDSIIYEGESHWNPVIAGESNKYKHFTEDWFRAGIKAQDVFQNQAHERGLILEVIKQDQDSFKSYTNGANSIPIKRGDFLIRNANNIEVDIKCRSFYRQSGERYFNFKIDDFNRHLNMISLTKTPIIIAVYERLEDGVKDDQLFMFEIEVLARETGSLECQFREDVGPCYKIPLGKTKKGFRIIEQYI